MGALFYASMSIVIPKSENLIRDGVIVILLVDLLHMEPLCTGAVRIGRSGREKLTGESSKSQCFIHLGIVEVNLFAQKGRLDIAKNQIDRKAG